MPMWMIWAALAGGVAMNIWYAIAWMALPHHHGDFRSAGKDTPLDAALRAAKLAPGLYIHPHYGDYPGAMKSPEFQAALQSAPRAWFVVMTQGADMGPGVFLRALAQNILEALAVAFLLQATAWGAGSLVGTVAAAAGLGVLARLPSLASMSNWMQLPWRYTVTSVLDGVVAYALVGVVVHLLR